MNYDFGFQLSVGNNDISNSSRNSSADKIDRYNEPKTENCESLTS